MEELLLRCKLAMRERLWFKREGGGRSVLISAERRGRQSPAPRRELVMEESEEKRGHNHGQRQGRGSCESGSLFLLAKAWEQEQNSTQ